MIFCHYSSMYSLVIREFLAKTIDENFLDFFVILRDQIPITGFCFDVFYPLKRFSYNLGKTKKQKKLW